MVFSFEKSHLSIFDADEPEFCNQSCRCQLLTGQSLLDNSDDLLQ